MTVDHGQEVIKFNTDIRLELCIGDKIRQIDGRVDRAANNNCTPRIHGNKALATWFQSFFQQYENVRVDFIKENLIRLSKTGEENKVCSRTNESVPGWTWVPDEKSWEDGYSALLRFVEKKRHARQ